MASSPFPGGLHDHFLFVNHDHRLTASESQGRVIRSHVQKGRHGRRWRGGPSGHHVFRPKSPETEKVSGLRSVDSTGVGLTDQSDAPVKGKLRELSSSEQHCSPPALESLSTCSLPQTSGSSGALESSANDDTRPFAEKSKARETPGEQQNARFLSERHLPSPISILQKGNSDAFNALAINIDPVDNHMLHFGVEMILPARFPAETRSKTPQKAFDGVVARGIEALRNQCQGYAWLSVFTMYFSLFTKDSALAARALRYKKRSSEILRSQMQADNANIRPCLVLLYTADVAARDVGAAGVNARVLEHLFEVAGSFEKINMQLLERALLIDSSHNISLTNRSPYAFWNWKLTPLFAEWKDVIGVLPTSRPPKSPTFNPCLKDDTLLNILGTLKEAVEFDEMLTSLDTLVEHDVFPSMQCHRLICQARLTNYYLDISEGLSDPPHASLQASTAIAALYWARIYFNDICYARMTGFSLSDLQTAIMRCETDSTAKSSAPAQWLWVLYVGAEAEQLMAALDGDTWHINRFVAQARAMGLRSWSQIRDVLRGFLYSDKIKPNGSEWWWKVAYD